MLAIVGMQPAPATGTCGAQQEWFMSCTSDPFGTVDVAEVATRQHILQQRQQLHQEQ